MHIQGPARCHNPRPPAGVPGVVADTVARRAERGLAPGVAGRVPRTLFRAVGRPGPAGRQTTTPVSAVPKLPVPTGDALMAVVARGVAECARWRATFLSWDPRHAVPQIVMNALDPALLELILGPGDPNSLVRLLRAHYADIRERFPGPFADVEQVWRIQRAWWMQFVEADDAEASSSALAATFATLDVLLPHPAGALYLRGQRPARRASPTRKPAPGPIARPAAAAPGARPARAGSAPVAGEQGHLPEGRRQAPAEADPGVHAAAAAAGSAASGGSGSGGPAAETSKPRAQAAATPVRPRVTGGRPAVTHRPAPAAAGSQASPAPGVRVAAAAAHSPAPCRPGQHGALRPQAHRGRLCLLRPCATGHRRVVPLVPRTWSTWATGAWAPTSTGGCASVRPTALGPRASRRGYLFRSKGRRA